MSFVLRESDRLNIAIRQEVADVGHPHVHHHRVCTTGHRMLSLCKPVGDTVTREQNRRDITQNRRRQHETPECPRTEYRKTEHSRTDGAANVKAERTANIATSPFVKAPI